MIGTQVAFVAQPPQPTSLRVATCAEAPAINGETPFETVPKRRGLLSVNGKMSVKMYSLPLALRGHPLLARQVYSKTFTEGQAELVRLVLTGPVILRVQVVPSP